MQRDTLTADKVASLTAYWKEGAAGDLVSARAICDRAEQPAAALFFVHLAVEKALKAAFVAAFATHAPYTHNLVVLVEKLGWDVDPERLAILAEMNEFNLEARYPEEKDDFRKRATTAFASRYLVEAERTMAWIEAKSATAS